MRSQEFTYRNFNQNLIQNPNENKKKRFAFSVKTGLKPFLSVNGKRFGTPSFFRILIAFQIRIFMMFNDWIVTFKIEIWTIIQIVTLNADGF